MWRSGAGSALFDRAGQVLARAVEAAEVDPSGLAAVLCAGDLACPPVVSAVAAGSGLPAVAVQRPRWAALLGAAEVTGPAGEVVEVGEPPLPAAARAALPVVPGVASVVLFTHFLVSAYRERPSGLTGAGVGVLLADWGELALAGLFAVVAVLCGATLLASVLPASDPFADPRVVGRERSWWDSQQIGPALAGACAVGVGWAALYAVVGSVLLDWDSGPFLRWVLLPLVPVVVVVLVAAVVATRGGRVPAMGWHRVVGFPAVVGVYGDGGGGDCAGVGDHVGDGVVGVGVDVVRPVRWGPVGGGGGVDGGRVGPVAADPRGAGRVGVRPGHLLSECRGVVVSVCGGGGGVVDPPVVAVGQPSPHRPALHRPAPPMTAPPEPGPGWPTRTRPGQPTRPGWPARTRSGRWGCAGAGGGWGVVIGRFMRSLPSLVLSAGLLVGLPAGLVVGVGWPLPSHWPSRAEWDQLAVQPLTRPVIVNAMAVLMWLLWAGYVYALTATAARRMARLVRRGMRLPPLPTPMQATAGGLLGAVLLNPGHPTTVAPAPPTPAVATQADHTPTPPTPPHTAQDDTSNPQGGRAVRLRSGGVSLPDGQWLNPILAATVASAATAVWQRRRAAYRPGPPTVARTDPDLAPLPDTITLIQDLLQPPPDLDDPHPPADVPDPPPAEVTGAGWGLPAGGVGMTGPAAHAAARALLTSALLPPTEHRRLAGEHLQPRGTGGDHHGRPAGPAARYTRTRLPRPEGRTRPHQRARRSRNDRTDPNHDHDHDHGHHRDAAADRTTRRLRPPLAAAGTRRTRRDHGHHRRPRTLARPADLAHQPRRHLAAHPRRHRAAQPRRRRA